jgi:transposase-like protein
VPWSVPNVMSIRLEFVAEALGRRRRFTALCEQYGISEKTGYKWLARFRAHGPAGLADASHTPHSCPHATPLPQRELLVALRRAHPTWGARKLLAWYYGPNDSVLHPPNPSINLTCQPGLTVTHQPVRTVRAHLVRST